MAAYTGRPHLHTATVWLVQAALFFGAWLACVGKASGGEILVGVPAAALAATASHVVLAEHLAALGPNTRALSTVVRAPWDILVDTVVVVRVLVGRLVGQPARGVIEVYQFPAGGDSGEDAVARALATLVTTLSPNSIVVDIDRGHARILVHVLESRGIPPALARLGARR